MLPVHYIVLTNFLNRPFLRIAEYFEITGTFGNQDIKYQINFIPLTIQNKLFMLAKISIYQNIDIFSGKKKALLKYRLYI